MEIGNQIKALRTQRGITQEDLACELGVSAQAVSKWERDAATPDIQLLPAISAYFGVTIDELFALSDETRMERIQNMLWDERVLNPATVETERAFLLEKGKREKKHGEVYRLLADIEYQLSEEHRRAAQEYAREAIDREPENNGAHSTFVLTSKGEWGAWYSTIRHELIDYYKKFVAEHPNWRSGYLWLIDQLIADNRLDEAQFYCERMTAETETGFRTAMYRGEIAWADGRRDEAFKIWDEMIRQFPEDRAALVCMGDYMARAGRYEEAKKHYRKSMDVQTEFPRYQDGLTSIAHICEIQGDYDGAIAANEEELVLLREEWNITSGEEIDAHRREIARLKERRDTKR